MNFRDFFDSGSRTPEEWLFACCKPKKNEVVETADVRELLDRDVNVNARDCVGSTPLFYAVKSNLRIAKLLLENGADINAQNEAGYTALSWAIIAKDTAAARFLIENGIDVNLAQTDGRTPLMAAVLKGDAETVGMLLDRGAALDAKDVSGQTALNYASFHPPIKKAIETFIYREQRKKAADNIRGLRARAPRTRAGRGFSP